MRHKPVKEFPPQAHLRLFVTFEIGSPEIYSGIQESLVLYGFVDFLVPTLPTVIAIAGVLVGIKLAKGESHKFWWSVFLVAGIAFSVLTHVSLSRTRKQHEREIIEQERAIADLKEVIQTNEIRNSSDTSYLKAKLEDALARQLVPFDVRLFAGNFERELQQNMEVLSKKTLSDDTSKFVRKLRQLDAEIETSRSQRYAVERQEMIIAMHDPRHGMLFCRNGST